MAEVMDLLGEDVVGDLGAAKKDNDDGNEEFWGIQVGHWFRDTNL